MKRSNADKSGDPVTGAAPVNKFGTPGPEARRRFIELATPALEKLAERNGIPRPRLSSA